jgi:hypothetical protein
MTLDSSGLEHIFPRTRIGENDDGPFTHRCTQVFKGGRVNIVPPRQISKHLLIKIQ